MSALWELKRATARELHDRIGEPSGLVYTTTAKVLDRLLAKGMVARGRVGMAFVYQPKVSRDVIERARARESVTRILGEDPVLALANLVEAVESIDSKLLGELSKVIAARRRSRSGS